MKVSVNIQLEATNQELKEWAVDVASRTGMKLIGGALTSLGETAEDFGPGIAQTLKSVVEAGVAAVRAGGMPAAAAGAPPETYRAATVGASPVPAAAPVDDADEELDASTMVCGEPGPGDTIPGPMWAPCEARVEYLVSNPKFGNRGRVRRACCENHMNFLTGAMPCNVIKLPIVTPAPPPASTPAAAPSAVVE